MRYLCVLLLVLCLSVPGARADTVSYEGTSNGTDYSLVIDTTDSRPWLFGRYGYAAFDLTVDGDRYDLNELIYSFGASVYVSPYGFELTGSTVTLTLPDARGNGLARLALTFARAYEGTVTVEGLLAYLVDTPLTSIRGFRRNGRELFDLDVPVTPVPLPAGAWLFGTGAALLTGRRWRRRLVELGGIEPPTS